jgi:hypothetical protein
MRYTIITKSKEAARPRRKSTLPHLFGGGRALICLKVNGPMTVRELGRAIKSDSSKTFRMMQVLLDAGIAVKCEIAGSREYLALNTRLPVYRELVSLLNALDALWPTPREKAYQDRRSASGFVARRRLRIGQTVFPNRQCGRQSCFTSQRSL